MVNKMKDLAPQKKANQRIMSVYCTRKRVMTIRWSFGRQRHLASAGNFSSDYRILMLVCASVTVVLDGDKVPSAGIRTYYGAEYISLKFAEKLLLDV